MNKSQKANKKEIKIMWSCGYGDEHKTRLEANECISRYLQQKTNQPQAEEQCNCECHPKRGWYKNYTNFITTCSHCSPPPREERWEGSKGMCEL